MSYTVAVANFLCQFFLYAALFKRTYSYCIKFLHDSRERDFVDGIYKDIMLWMIMGLELFYIFIRAGNLLWQGIQVIDFLESFRKCRQEILNMDP